MLLESGYNLTTQEVASQTSDNGGALSDTSMDAGSISNSCQVNPSHCFYSFPSLTLRKHESRSLKSAERIDTNPPGLCAHCQEANCTCVRSMSTAPRGRRMGESPDRDRAAQPPLTPFPESSEIHLLGIVQTQILFHLYGKAVQTRALDEAAQIHRKFVKEQSEKALAKLAALRQSTATQPGPRGKRAETIQGNSL